MLAATQAGARQRLASQRRSTVRRAATYAVTAPAPADPMAVLKTHSGIASLPAVAAGCRTGSSETGAVTIERLFLVASNPCRLAPGRRPRELSLN
jgi:hypothetical protein